MDSSYYSASTYFDSALLTRRAADICNRLSECVFSTVQISELNDISTSGYLDEREYIQVFYTDVAHQLQMYTLKCICIGIRS